MGLNVYLVIGGGVLLMSVLGVMLYKAYKLGKTIGREEAQKNENKKNIEMAEKLYDNDPNSNLNVRDSKLWFQ